MSAAGELVSSAVLPYGVVAVSWSPDGEWIAAGTRTEGPKGGIAVVEAESGHVRWQQYGEWSVEGLMVSRDGNWLAIAEVWRPSFGSEKEFAARAGVVGAGSGTERWRVSTEIPPTTYFITPAVAFSPDTRSVAVYWTFHTHSYPDRTKTKAWVFDAETGIPRCELHGHNEVRGLSFSSDSRWVVAACTDGAAVFDAMTGEQRPRSFAGDVLAAEFSPDDRWVTAGCADGTARVFEADTGDPVSVAPLGQDEPDGTVAEVMSVAFSPDGRWVAGVTRSGARVFDAGTGAPRFPAPVGVPVPGGAYPGWKVIFSPDLRHVTMSRNQYSGTYVGGLSTLDAGSGAIGWQVTADGFINDLGYSPDANRIVAAGPNITHEGGLVRVYDAGVERSRLEHRGPVSRVATSTAGMRLVATASDNLATVFHADSGDLLLERAHPGVLTWIAFTPDGGHFVTGATTGARLFETVSGRPVWTLAHGPVNAVAISPDDGEWVATASNDRNARVVRRDNGEERWTSTHSSAVGHIAFSSDARWVATGAGRTTRILDAVAGDEVLRVDHAGAVQALAANPVGALLATANRDGMVQLIDPSTSEQLEPIPHPQAVTAVAFSPDGSLLATGGTDRAVRLFGLADGQPTLRHQLTYDSPITMLAFQRDGRGLAIVTENPPVRIVNPDGGEELRRLLHPAPVRHLAFGADLLTTACEDNTARVYAVPSEQ